ncbi:hypothetical protein [Lentzea guizhouensis]|uniref:hypothetical protein n=1 Tax=Lentzea guizhouensis TaxID=1586287 RepID=UPI0012B6A0F0|nr:hypothetical protein [Lentzea guizhouensis]
MPVKVSVVEPNHNMMEHDHAKGERISVEDGHLIVHGPQDGPRRPAVAIYAPKQWYKAEVQE